MRIGFFVGVGTYFSRVIAEIFVSGDFWCFLVFFWCFFCDFVVFWRCVLCFGVFFSSSRVSANFFLVFFPAGL